MTRDDLKPGYVVQLRNGELRMIMPVGNCEELAVIREGAWCPLNPGYDRNLMRARMDSFGSSALAQMAAYDIVKVFGCSPFPHRALELNTICRPVLWERHETKKMTVRQICEALGYDVEIVKEDNNA